MATTTQGRSLHYRLARFHKFTKGPLQTLLSRALRKLDDPQDRLEATDAGASSNRLINYVSPYGGMLCGNMFVYNKGASQLLMRAQRVKDEGDTITSFPLEALVAPAEDGTRREFLESILYFCIRGDHVLLLQSQGLRAKAMEQYLFWLFSKAGEFSGEQSMMLADQASTSTSKAIEKSGVKSVSLGIPLIPVQKVPTSDRKHARLSLGGPVIAALRAYMGSQVDHLKLEDALDGNIQATIELHWSRQTTEPAQNVLDNLAVALRDIDPDDVEIQLNNGTKLKGNDLKIAVPVAVQTRDGIVNQSSLFKAMREAMQGLIEDGSIKQ